jgi:hypothetical protein
MPCILAVLADSVSKSTYVRRVGDALSGADHVLLPLMLHLLWIPVQSRQDHILSVVIDELNPNGILVKQSDCSGGCTDCSTSCDCYGCQSA